MAAGITRDFVIGLYSSQYQAVTDSLEIPEGPQAVFSGAVDMALRALGTQETDLETAVIDPLKATDYLALADYYTLEALLRHTPAFADMQAYTPAVAKKRSQVFAQLRQLRDDAAQKVQMLGYMAVSTQPNNTFEMIRLELDYFEPDYGGF